MAPEKLLQIAQVLKSNGTDGELVLGFRDFGPEDIDLEEPVFVYFDGLPVPFFFESYRVRGGRALARLTGVRNLRDADELAGKAVWGSREVYELGEEDFADLSGWTLRDSDGRVMGRVSAFEDIPGNPCIIVLAEDGSEVMVPLHEDLIESMDEKSREITMNLPAGLFP